MRSLSKMILYKRFSSVVLILRCWDFTLLHLECRVNTCNFACLDIWLRICCPGFWCCWSFASTLADISLACSGGGWCAEIFASASGWTLGVNIFLIYEFWCFSQLGFSLSLFQVARRTKGCFRRISAKSGGRLFWLTLGFSWKFLLPLGQAFGYFLRAALVTSRLL